jgi:hypothetical protein
LYGEYRPITNKKILIEEKILKLEELATELLETARQLALMTFSGRSGDFVFG